MKVIAEFDTVEEILGFVGAFGTKDTKASRPTQGVICSIDSTKTKELVETKKEVPEVKAEKIVEEKIAPVAEKDTYFFHPESTSYWMLPKGEVIPTGIDAQSSVEISKEDYEKETAKVDAPKEEDPNTKVKITKEMVRELFGRIIKAGKQTEAKALTTKYGATKLPEVKEKDYEAIFKEAEALV